MMTAKSSLWAQLVVMELRVFMNTRKVLGIKLDLILLTIAPLQVVKALVTTYTVDLTGDASVLAIGAGNTDEPLGRTRVYS